MALALFAEEDYEEVWTRLSETLANWGCWEDSQAAVTTGGITQARQRLGQRTVRIIRRRAGLFYPRVVKRARHNSYRVNKPGHHGTPAAIKLCNLALTREKTENAA